MHDHLSPCHVAAENQFLCKAEEECEGKEAENYVDEIDVLQEKQALCKQDTRQTEETGRGEALIANHST